MLNARLNITDVRSLMTLRSVFERRAPRGIRLSASDMAYLRSFVVDEQWQRMFDEINVAAAGVEEAIAQLRGTATDKARLINDADSIADFGVRWQYRSMALSGRPETANSFSTLVHQFLREFDRATHPHGERIEQLRAMRCKEMAERKARAGGGSPSQSPLNLPPHSHPESSDQDTQMEPDIPEDVNRGATDRLIAETLAKLQAEVDTQQSRDSAEEDEFEQQGMELKAWAPTDDPEDVHMQSHDSAHGTAASYDSAMKDVTDSARNHDNEQDHLDEVFEIEDPSSEPTVSEFCDWIVWAWTDPTRISSLTRGPLENFVRFVGGKAVVSFEFGGVDGVAAWLDAVDAAGVESLSVLDRTLPSLPPSSPEEANANLVVPPIDALTPWRMRELGIVASTLPPSTNPVIQRARKVGQQVTQNFLVHVLPTRLQS
nr:hypothetical protein HK105_003585 [Polyrhizophydium stewartii]